MAAEGAGAPKPSDLPALPDKVISEILPRLPPKALLRSRAVCRAWRRLATDCVLLLDHHLRRPPQPLLHAHREDGDGNEPALLQYCLEAVDLRTDKRRMAVRFTDGWYDDDSLGTGVYGLFEVHASCNGLLLLNLLDRLFVCNTATRQATSFLPLRAREIAGLYRTPLPGSTGCCTTETTASRGSTTSSRWAPSRRGASSVARRRLPCARGWREGWGAPAPRRPSSSTAACTGRRSGAKRTV